MDLHTKVLILEKLRKHIFIQQENWLHFIRLNTDDWAINEMINTTIRVLKTPQTRVHLFSLVFCQLFFFLTLN